MSSIARLVHFFSILPGRRESGDARVCGSDNFERLVADFHRHINASRTDDMAFSGKELFVYLHLIRSWFSYLSLKHQADKETIQNMKENYIEYILCLKELQLSRFIFAKGGGAEIYRERYAAAKKIKEEIELAFAKALGEEALVELELVRSLPARCFDAQGNRVEEGCRSERTEAGAD